MVSFAGRMSTKRSWRAKSRGFFMGECEIVEGRRVWFVQSGWRVRGCNHDNVADAFLLRNKFLPLFGGWQKTVLRGELQPSFCDLIVDHVRKRSGQEIQAGHHCIFSAQKPGDPGDRLRLHEVELARLPDIERVEVLVFQSSFGQKRLPEFRLQSCEAEQVFSVVFQNPPDPVIAETAVAVVENVIF